VDNCVAYGRSRLRRGGGQALPSFSVLNRGQDYRDFGGLGDGLEGPDLPGRELEALAKQLAVDLNGGVHPRIIGKPDAPQLNQVQHLFLDWSGDVRGLDISGMLLRGVCASQ